MTLSHPTASGAVIDLSFGGTATEGSDYTASSDSIYIPAGSSSGSITLTGNDNLLASASETIVVTMTSVTGAYGEVPQQVTATLNNISQTTGSISGTVVANTSTGPGIPGVLVYIDENGNGTFEPVANGRASRPTRSPPRSCRELHLQRADARKLHLAGSRSLGHHRDQSRRRIDHCPGDRRCDGDGHPVCRHQQ